MPQGLLQRERSRAITDIKPPAYPLRRHCIESYLIDPPFLESAIGATGVAGRLEEMARQRRWHDVCRAALDEAAYEVRGERPKLASAPGSLEQAIDVVRQALSTYEGSIHAALRRRDAEGRVRAFDEDFSADGPLWTRVDGKELLASLELSLRPSPALRGGNLANRLLRYAEQEGPPAPLVEDMKELLTGILQR